MTEPATVRESTLTPIAVVPLAAVGVATAAVHGAALAGYGYFRDELYYLASRDHLAFGFVDQPPLSIVALAGWTAVFGDSVIAIRLLALLFTLVAVALAGLLARELGGGAFAQGLAALGFAFSPVLMGTVHTFSMNVLDAFFWLLAAWLLARAVRTGDQRTWIWLGLVLGLGLQNKISVLWLGAGIAAGLLLTSARSLLRTRGPWIAGAIAMALFLPYVLWNWRHGFPTLEFMHNAETQKMVQTPVLDLIQALLLEMNPLSAPIWLGGLAWTLFGKDGRRWRLFGIVWLAVFAIVAFNGAAKVYYLGPATSLLLAPGAVAAERLLVDRRGALRWALAPGILAFGLIAVPLALPLLSEPSYVAYAAALGSKPRYSERSALGELPQHFADQHGWEEMVAAVERAYRNLTPEEQDQAAVFGQNYGEASAIAVLGARRGLPPALSGHNSFWLWGPRGRNGEVVIILGGDAGDNSAWFESTEIVDRVRCDYCMPYERDLPVTIGRGMKVSLAEAWTELKRFI